MADHLKVSTEEMQTAITKYNQAQQTLDEAYKAIDAAREHLDNCYKGPGYMALSAKLVAISLNVRTTDRAIDETIQGLTTTKNTMETTEQDITSTSSGLETGTSSPVYL